LRGSSAAQRRKEKAQERKEAQKKGIACSLCYSNLSKHIWQ
jgi:hypothetical protein